MVSSTLDIVGKELAIGEARHDMLDSLILGGDRPDEMLLEREIYGAAQCLLDELDGTNADPREALLDQLRTYMEQVVDPCIGHTIRHFMFLSNLRTHGDPTLAMRVRVIDHNFRTAYGEALRSQDSVVLVDGIVAFAHELGSIQVRS